MPCVYLTTMSRVPYRRSYNAAILNFSFAHLAYLDFLHRFQLHSSLLAAVSLLAFVCFSFFFFRLRVLDKAEYSAFESTLNCSIVSYRIVSYNIALNDA